MMKLLLVALVFATLMAPASGGKSFFKKARSYVSSLIFGTTKSAPLEINEAEAIYGCPELAVMNVDQCAVFYDEVNCQKNLFALGENKELPKLPDEDNDKATTIAVKPLCHVQVWEDENFKVGEDKEKGSKVLLPGAHLLPPTLNDDVSSAKCTCCPIMTDESDPCVRLFDDHGCAGQLIDIDPVPVMSSLKPEWVNRTASIAVKKGCRFTGWRDEPQTFGEGAHELISNDLADIKCVCDPTF